TPFLLILFGCGPAALGVTSMRSSRAGPFRRLGAAAATALVTLASAIGPVLAAPDDGPALKPDEATPPKKIEAPKLVLQSNKPGAFKGYPLVARLNSTKSYLIDMQGRVVRIWESRYTAGQEAYLLENGHLLRAATLDNRERLFGGAGQGGRVQEFDWDGHLVWDFKFHDDNPHPHHPIARL